MYPFWNYILSFRRQFCNQERIGKSGGDKQPANIVKPKQELSLDASPVAIPVVSIISLSQQEVTRDEWMEWYNTPNPSASTYRARLEAEAPSFNTETKFTNHTNFSVFVFCKDIHNEHFRVYPQSCIKLPNRVPVNCK